jgi:predicted DNA-binding transcriptional regulator AlpA
MRTPEAAQYCGLTAAMLEKLRSLGGGPFYYKVGPKRVMYDRADLDAWIRAKKFASTSQRIASTPESAPVAA